jgi:hypothetical protein
MSDPEFKALTTHCAKHVLLVWGKCVLLRHSSLTQCAMKSLVEFARKFPTVFDFILLKERHYEGCDKSVPTIGAGKNGFATFAFANSGRTFFAKLPQTLPVRTQFFDYTYIDGVLNALAQVDSVSNSKIAAYLVNFIVQLYGTTTVPKVDVNTTCDNTVNVCVTLANKSCIKLNVVHKNDDFAFFDTKSEKTFMVSAENFAQQLLSLQLFYTEMIARQSSSQKMLEWLPRWNGRTIKAENATHVAHIAFCTQHTEESRKNQIAKYFGLVHRKR